jgi:ribosomal protein S18 acetylase RimI-like enzyme
VPRETEFEIVDYSVRYGAAFERLNLEWLEKYFHVEPIDRENLGDPEGTILGHGGAILYALHGDAVVGTVALKHHGGQVFELTKMAVTSGYQGRGLGRQLLCAALRRFADLDGKSLYLESHSSLTPALALYESAGFRHTNPPRPSDYERADVYMVYRRE